MNIRYYKGNIRRKRIRKRKPKKVMEQNKKSRLGMTRTCKAIGAKVAGAPLEKLEITRRSCAADDVAIKIKYAGICHSGASI
jgi:threonine dehydrogenase-like Zn-dependent dehydrogenase